MIERAFAPALGVATVAAAVTDQPVHWSFLGYPFEAASMVAAIFAAVTTRVIIGLRDHSHTPALDAAVLVLVLVTTASVVAGWHTNLVGGLLYGTGFATIGEGILRVAEYWTNKGLAMMGVEPPAPPASDDDHPAAISTAMGQLKRLPDVTRDSPAPPTI